MKSKDVQQIVLSKLQNGQFPMQISRDLNGMVSIRTIKRWSKLYNETGAIELWHPPGPSRMVWLGVCANGVSKVVFLESGTVNQDTYINEVLPVAKKFGNKQFGNDWCFEQDGARAHTAARSQNWCRENLPNFIEKDRWPANSPDLNPLDYSIWNEIVQGMNWDKVECKESLKAQILLSVKKIRPQVVLDSCSSFYTRIRSLVQSDGSYLRE